MLYLLLTSLVSGAFARAPAGPWDAFNYAPASRNVSPATILSSTGNVSGIPSDLIYTSNTAFTFSGVNSSVVFDFGKEVIFQKMNKLARVTEKHSRSAVSYRSPSQMLLKAQLLA